MSESVIADFVGKFHIEGRGGSKPVRGRVVLSQKRLVLAADRDDTATIPLSAIFDIAVGHIPPDLRDFFESTVTIAFERTDDRNVAVVEADDDKIEKFGTVLFKALLNGTEVTVKHPATVGGRVTDAEFRPAKLSLRPGRLAFEYARGRTEISLPAVTDFQRDTTRVAGRTRPVLKVRHLEGGQATSTVLATDSPRKMSLLGRYLRIEYSELVSDLADVDLAPEQKELLVAIYSGAEGVASLAGVLDLEASRATMLVEDLREAGLVVDGDAGTTLTPKGNVYVNHHLEDVNS